nr:hypothetical protein [Pseudodesulfovibrio sp.]
MNKRIIALILVALTFSLWGCGDKLTEETARQIIEKEVLGSQEDRGFSRIVFAKGSDGFEYFQKLISQGKLQLTMEEEEALDFLSKEKTIVKTYEGNSEVVNILKSLKIRDEVDHSKLSMMDVMDIGTGHKKKMPKKTVCIAIVRLKKESVKSIDGIFNDEKHGTAMVKFTISQVGIEPYYSELCPLMYPGEPEGSGRCGLRKPYSTEIQLKKYDEGWNIDMNPS